MKIVWSPEAEQDRGDIMEYIAEDNPVAAARMDDLFARAAAKLSDFPYLGHAGKVPGTRELIPHESYRLVYEVYGESVRVLALVNVARQWPPAPDR
ncbi:type II toxin-antitoxin system RelE/ParE family toxin [Pseudoduganella namucuonensis]|uniref:Addiction module toxin, RelE/StbE family n=1 Tax=Pseudoduganella namucuonensis TaxID=1035707 RepID=A0A1I7IT60_9BURK|nr:type II toxin-antitoxin system RelE/ParE family toxin [Pseudoduganella namucuonensis]SFU76099.1 addiction module toxin, RelE/StbE family [Pseudoduganella namucuonensis]